MLKIADNKIADTDELKTRLTDDQVAKMYLYYVIVNGWHKLRLSHYYCEYYCYYCPHGRDGLYFFRPSFFPG